VTEEVVTEEVVTEEVVTEDVVSPVEVDVPGTVDAPPETSPDAAAEEDEVAVPEAMLDEPVVAVTNSSPAAETAAGIGTSGMTPDESAAIAPQARDVQGQAEEKQVAPSATVTASEVVTEQLESPAPDMAPSTPATEPVTDPQPASVAAPATITVTESEVVTEQLELPAPDMAPSTPVTEPVTDPQPASVAAPATSLESDAGKSAYESLAAAREAYWLRDYEGAENHYRLLIQLEPDNPDWYGELGNMYFAQGQWQQAAAVYYEAGVRLLNDGKVVQASQMVDVIRGLNGVEADDLEEQINASQVAP
jgi:tetratricopeptide (TPR) repeat protein